MTITVPSNGEFYTNCALLVLWALMSTMMVYMNAFHNCFPKSAFLSKFGYEMDTNMGLLMGITKNFSKFEAVLALCGLVGSIMGWWI